MSAENSGIQNVDEWFLSAINQPEDNINELMKFLSELHLKVQENAKNETVSRQQKTKRDQFFDCLQQELIDKKLVDSLLNLLKLKVDWLKYDLSTSRDAQKLLFRFSADAQKILLDACEDEVLATQIEAIDFATLKPMDAFEKLENLKNLKEGSYCVDKIWGFGVVVGYDLGNKKIFINFDKKPNHTMSLGYAAGTAKAVGEDHILAFRHKNVDEFDQMCKDAPHEIVRMAIRSYGPMSMLKLEKELEAGGVQAAYIDWKEFWKKARQGLKGDKEIKFPAANKKSDPITLVEKVAEPGDNAWLTALAANKDVADIMKNIASYLQITKKSGERVALEQHSENAVDILKDRLSFALKACGTTRNNRDKFRFALMAYQLGFDTIPVKMLKKAKEFVFVKNADGEDTEEVDIVATLRFPDLVMKAAVELPATDMDLLVKIIPIDSDIELVKEFLDQIEEMSFSLFERIAKRLNECANEAINAEFVSRMKSIFAEQKIPFAVLYWFCKNIKNIEKGKYVSSFALVTSALVSLEGQEIGDNLKLQHLIAKCFLDKKWLFDEITETLDPIERKAFFDRVSATDRAWEAATKRAIIAALIERYPELAPKQKEEEEDALPKYLGCTSWKSLNELKAKYDHLVNVEKPQNVKDISTARSYGDLRENFEYQAAKDYQRVLENKEEEMVKEINSLRGTDFSEFIAAFKGKVYVATTVLLRYANSEEKKYTILGEKDTDLENNIISSRSSLAKALMTHVAGEEIEIEGENTKVTIVAVEPASQEILDMVKA